MLYVLKGIGADPELGETAVGDFAAEAAAAPGRFKPPILLGRREEPSPVGVSARDSGRGIDPCGNFFLTPVSLFVGADGAASTGDGSGEGGLEDTGGGAAALGAAFETPFVAGFTAAAGATGAACRAA